MPQRTSRKLVSIVGYLLSVACLPAATNLTIQGVNRAEFWQYLNRVQDTVHRDSLRLDTIWRVKDLPTTLEDKLDLNVRYGDLNGALGLFLFEPSKPWAGVRQPMRLLDYTIAYSPKKFEILYGKYFQTFGKGLALRAYSDDDFRHYKSLHGLRGIAHLPLRTDLVLLGGRLRDVFFQENVYKILNSSDSGDQVLGADLTTRPFKPIGLGGRYVRINRSSDPTPRAFTELFGGNASAAVGPIEVYGEACWRLGTKPGIGGRENGLGCYLNSSLSIGGYSLLAEYMDYNNLAVPPGLYHYNDPPTPIKSGVAINRGSDERGFGITATATPISPLYLEADFGRLFTHDNASAGVVEVEGKSRYSPGADWTFEAKLNHMSQKNIETGTLARITDRPTVHANYLLGNHTFVFEGELGFVAERSTDTILHPKPWNYHEPALTLSYGYGANLLFTVGWQGVDNDSLKRYDYATSWPMFETVWTITDRNVLRMRIGAEKGGYTCSGGVCRYEAPFTGAKLQLISRF